MAPEIILTNAQVVTPGEVVRCGTTVLRDGLIAAIDRGVSTDTFSPPGRGRLSV